VKRTALIALLLVVFASGASGAVNKPLLGVSGNADHFQSQTGQKSVVRQAFLSWDQGNTWGAPFAMLFHRLAPVPLIHIGTRARPPRNTSEAISPMGIAKGQGDAYLIAMNNAISAWGRLVYVRPMAEMNNPVNLYSYEHKRDSAHDPGAYRQAFCRVYVLLHGGSAAAMTSTLHKLGMPGVSTSLPVNSYPEQLRVIWNPLAGIEKEAAPAARYYPGDACVDMIGNDMYSSSVGGGAWAENERLYASHPNKQYSFAELGLEGVDDPSFIQKVCQFIRTHRRVELAAFYMGKPGSPYDLGNKPASRGAYRTCLTPMGGPAPLGAIPLPGAAVIGPLPATQLLITGSPLGGSAPLGVTFALRASMTRPVAQWQVIFGDATVTGGAGSPPPTLTHTYARDGVYNATLIVYTSPPFTGTALRLVAGTNVEVGSQALAPLSFTQDPAGGKAPLKVIFKALSHPPRAIVSWQLLFGDGTATNGPGMPPHFFGHTYKEKGAYRAVLIESLGASARLIGFADVRVG
jgi:hypothetical protein